MGEIKKVVVGFSGGVDSAATVKILQKQGFEPVAVFLKMFSNKNLVEIENLAKKLGVELMIKDVSDFFKNCIIKNFLREYKNNRTPNPCVKCNFEIKFKILLEVANELEIEKVATGHYTRIEENEKIFKLLKGRDEKKDQSYFLYRLTQKELARIIFPLGKQVKEDIKKEALKNNWFEKIHESQDICFLENQEKIQDFLKNNLDEVDSQIGEIRNEEEKVLGRHQGLVFYTQGQRKGLGLAGGPFYVVGKNSEKNILLVSKNKKHQTLMNKEIIIEQVNWIDQKPEKDKIYLCKSRYRSKLTPGKIIKEKNNWKVILAESQWAVAEGQSLVIYDRDEVVGGGIINKSCV